jgi:hypothetical protein
VLHQQGEDGPFGEREDGAGREPEDEDRRRGDAQGEGEGGARGPRNRDLAGRWIVPTSPSTRQHLACGPPEIVGTADPSRLRGRPASLPLRRADA